MRTATAPKREPLLVPLSKGERRKVQKIADHWGVSLSEAIRKAIDAYVIEAEQN
jgi:archaellum biogenesis protein FlaJ (TadC family)